jgi:hypothetical protein
MPALLLPRWSFVLDVDPTHALVRELAPGPVDDRLRPVLVRREEREDARCAKRIAPCAPSSSSAEHLHDCLHGARSPPSCPVPCRRKASPTCPRRGGRSSFPTCSPDWRATEPSCGSTWSVFESVIAATSPTTKTPGWPGELEIRSTAIRLPRCSSIPERFDELFALEPRAPDERGRGDHARRSERHASRRGQPTAHGRR